MKTPKTPILAALLALAVPAAATAHGNVAPEETATRAERDARDEHGKRRNADAQKPRPRAEAPPPVLYKKPPRALERRPPKPFYEGNPRAAWKQEHNKHMKRLAKLDRIEQLAVARGDPRLQRKVRILRGQELARHQKWLKKRAKKRGAPPAVKARYR